MQGGCTSFGDSTSDTGLTDFCQLRRFFDPRSVTRTRAKVVWVHKSKWRGFIEDEDQMLIGAQYEPCLDGQDSTHLPMRLRCVENLRVETN